ncbi:hypothetical protein [Luteolibacter marinus]|uniref:hypothetical protein n=1 Tax=Luteolibacter marinus TaxID=2776705 RepID=UPI0018679524|nr:hypothetical protein [Luteolibacter marinus]
MNPQLHQILSHFGTLAYWVAIAFAALACHRLAGISRDRAFRLARFAALGFLGLHGIYFLSDWALLLLYQAGFSLPTFINGFFKASSYILGISNFLLCAFFILFAIGAARSNPRRKQPEPS